MWRVPSTVWHLKHPYSAERARPCSTRLARGSTRASGEPWAAGCEERRASPRPPAHPLLPRDVAVPRLLGRGLQLHEEREADGEPEEEEAQRDADEEHLVDGARLDLGPALCLPPPPV